MLRKGLALAILTLGASALPVRAAPFVAQRLDSTSFNADGIVDYGATPMADQTAPRPLCSAI